MTIESEDIEALANTPKRTRTDEGSVEERSVDDMIKADRYTSAKRQGTRPPWGWGIARIKPGGTIKGS